MEYLLTLARDIGVIDADDHGVLRGFVRRAGQLVGGLHRSLRRRDGQP